MTENKILTILAMYNRCLHFRTENICKRDTCRTCGFHQDYKNVTNVKKAIIEAIDKNIYPRDSEERGFINRELVRWILHEGGENIYSGLSEMKEIEDKLFNENTE